MELNPLKSAFDQLCRISPNIKRALWRTWYNYLVKMDKDAELLFMNYGHAEIEPNAPLLPLQAAEEKYRYCMQLYHHVAQAIDLTGKEVLEVGCGRGGGAAYLATRFRPAVMQGVDFSQNAIAFCKKYHAVVPNVTFVHGDAEALPFEAGSFDVVVNVESSHSYGTIARFFSEVYRVLRPQGYFLLADFRDAPDIPVLQQQLRATRFQLVRTEVITRNIVKALELDHDRKVQLIRQKVPGIFYKPFLTFAATKNSKTYATFNSGETEYLYFILQKARAHR
jgi:ubiquinone/menaquinone biosynthesis C-methylase UbiE